MKCVCMYDADRDNSTVDQFGFVNLVECLKNGEVPNSISDTEDIYNNIEDPCEILGKPRDVFEAYKMSDYIKKVGISEPKAAEQP